MTEQSIPSTATLLIHVCQARRAYRATFSTAQQAISFLEARKSTHNFEEIRGLHGEGLGSIPAEWTDLLEYVYPTCEHGMSADLCYGPGHYMSNAQERAMGWDYSDAPAGF